MPKELWEYALKELDAEIAVIQSILEAGGYVERVAERLNALQEHRAERIIEADILRRSRYAREVLGLGKTLFDGDGED